MAGVIQGKETVAASVGLRGWGPRLGRVLAGNPEGRHAVSPSLPARLLGAPG